MAARKPLRAVAPGEAAPVAQKFTVAQAAATGDHRALLVAMRERIAKAVSSEDCPPRDLAALTRRLQDISKEIEALVLRAREEGSDADDVAADEEWSAEAL
jgi:hypothetical protein